MLTIYQGRLSPRNDSELDGKIITLTIAKSTFQSLLFSSGPHASPLRAQFEDIALSSEVRLRGNSLSRLPYKNLSAIIDVDRNDGTPRLSAKNR